MTEREKPGTEREKPATEHELPAETRLEAELTWLPSGLRECVSSPARLVVSLLCLGWSGFQLYIALVPASFGVLGQRAIHLMFAYGVLYALAVNRAKSWVARLALTVLGLASVATAVLAYSGIESQQLYAGYFPPWQVVLSVVGLILLMESARRVIGLTLPIVGLVFLAYGIFGDSAPGILRLPTNDPGSFLGTIFLGPEGVFGPVLGASVTYIFVFILFGAFILQFGGDRYLLRLLRPLLVRSEGGAAKASVLGSLAFGSVTDSTTANATTTGSVTIPLMIRSGLSRKFASGTEASAAVGAMFMPPVMGATAFVMASVTGIPYTDIAVAALLPALLYYVALYFGVRAEVRAKRIPAPPAPDIATASRGLAGDSVVFLVPFALLIYLLIGLRYSAPLSAVYSIGLLVVLYLLRERTLRAAEQCVLALIRGAQSVVMVAMVVALVGTIVGPILVSGIGLKLTGVFLSVAGGSIVVLLILTMAAALLLGSGLPSSATYILLAVLAAPSLVELGVPLLVAHMFIFYFGCMSDLTPPTMATVYVTSGIAGSRPFASSVMAMSLAVGGFVIPFMFVGHPGLLLEGTWTENVIDTALAVVAVVAAVHALRRWLIGPLPVALAIVLLAGSLLLISPSVPVIVAGLCVIAGVAAVQVAVRMRSTRSGPVEVGT